MFRYILSLLLTNTYYCSLGVPLSNTVSFAVKLQDLSYNCSDPWLSNNILEKIKSCNETIQTKHKNGLMCLMFYDINSQLCSAGANLIKPDHIKKIGESLNVNTLCQAAQSWSFSNIPEHSDYGKIANDIFKKNGSCTKACANEEDVSSDESNYFCKYFKWGMDMLAIQTINYKDIIKTDTTVTVTQPESKTGISSAVSSTINNIPDNKTIIKDTSKDNSDSNQAKAVSTIISTNGSIQKTKTDLVLSDIPASNVTTNKIEDAPLEEEKKLPGVENVKEKVKGIIERPVNNENQESVVDNSKMKPQNNDMDDDQDDDDDEHDDDGLGDPIGNDLDGDDQGFNSDPKLDFDKSKSNEKKIESITSFNGDISQRDMFPNTIQDTFAEDDDHFFPFFMTVIIVIVLLYILYHNKNKFTKVLLGLIVEGRQSSRRRNSRGHAYRRLDTLEQAMNSNTTAPPSKIIY